MTNDEYRVAVELGDEGHGLSLGDRLHSLDLDDDARERLGSAVIVTRDGPHLCLYASTRESAGEAERVVGELLAEEQIPAQVRTTRWHPVEHEWVDADAPMPETAEEVAPSADEDDEDFRPEDPRFVQLASYKPRFLRDLGL